MVDGYAHDPLLNSKILWVKFYILNNNDKPWIFYSVFLMMSHVVLAQYDVGITAII